MNRLTLIIKREYLTRVRKKSFIIMTLLMPVLMVGITFLPLWLANINEGSVKNIAVIDNTGIYAPELQSTHLFNFQIIDKNEGEDPHSRIGKDLFAILQITDDLNKNPGRVSIVSEKQVPQDLQSLIERTLVEKVKQQRLEELTHSTEVNTETVNQVRSVLESKTGIALKTMRLSGDGNMAESSTAISSMVGMAFTILVYMFILMYGGMVMQSVLEEKKSRIIEVMVSSVKPVKLLIGKIMGVGLVGITQLLLWGILAGGLFALMSFFFAAPPTGNELASAGMSDFNVSEILNAVMSVNWFEIIFYFIVFFIGGYILYASIFAMFASAVDSDEDTQQFMMPVTLIIMFAFFAGIYSISNPDGPLAFWASLIPFSSPIVMMVRIPFGVPWWEKLLSITLLYGTFVLISYFAAKVYRVGILMYGKKPSIKEMIKWMKYK